MINEFINDVCDILNILVPEVSFDTSYFGSDTMLAQCAPDGKEIYIKPFQKITPDILFAVAHELRHIWQLKSDKALYFANYKPVDLIGNIEAYNLQIAEIDANAFAGLIMIDFFGLSPLFEGVSDAVKSKISDRMQEIALSYDMQSI